MELINNASKIVIEGNRKTGKPTMHFDTRDKWVSFSKKACYMFEILEGKRVNFLVELDRLFFYIDDNKDGMRICLLKNAYDSEDCRAYGTLIIRALQTKFPMKVKRGATFSLREIPTKTNGCKTIEVLLHKKIN